MSNDRPTMRRESKNKNRKTRNYRCLPPPAACWCLSTGEGRIQRVGQSTSAVINLNQQMPSRVYTDWTEGTAMPIICYGREAESKEKEQDGRNGERGRIYQEKGILWICSQGKETSPTQTATKSQRQPRNNPLLPLHRDDACTQEKRGRVGSRGSKKQDVQKGRERPKRVETTEVKTERNQNRGRLETVLNHFSLSLSLSNSASNHDQFPNSNP